MKKGSIILTAVVVAVSLLLLSCGAAGETAFGPPEDSAAPSGQETARPASWPTQTAQEDPTAPSATTEPQAEPEATASAPAPVQALSGQMAALQEQLEAAISDYDGVWSVYVYVLDTGESISVAEQPMVAASLIKLFVAGAYCQAVARGELPDSYGGDLMSMLSQSSNSACNRLIRLLGQGDASVGMTVVNQFAQQMDCPQTVLNREMLANSSLENYTTPAECGKLLQAIYEGACVSQDASNQILDALQAQERTGKIPAGLPEGTQTANKTGELSGVENDAAVVWSPSCTYILCVMSNQVPAAGKAQQHIRELSALVYADLNP